VVIPSTSTQRNNCYIDSSGAFGVDYKNIFKNTKDVSSVILLNIFFNHLKFAASRHILYNNYCFSLQIPNIVIDRITRDPESIWSRVIDGFSSYVFSLMRDETKTLIGYSLNELAVAPLHDMISAIQRRVLKNERSLLAIITRIAIASLIIGSLNYQTAVDWDTRHHSNYLTDLTMRSSIDNLVCEQQASFDSAATYALIGAIAHGALYEYNQNFIWSNLIQIPTVTSMISYLAYPNSFQYGVNIIQNI